MNAIETPEMKVGNLEEVQEETEKVCPGLKFGEHPYTIDASSGKLKCPHCGKSKG